MTNEGAVALGRVAEKRGWSQARLAKEIGLKGNSYITRLLSGERFPSWKLATEIERIFPGVKVALWRKACDARRAA